MRGLGETEDTTLKYGYSKSKVVLPGVVSSSVSDSRVGFSESDTWSSHIILFLLPLIQNGQLSVSCESNCTLVNRLGSLSHVVRLIDHPDMIIAVYHGHSAITQQQQSPKLLQRHQITKPTCTCT